MSESCPGVRFGWTSAGQIRERISTAFIAACEYSKDSTSKRFEEESLEPPFPKVLAKGDPFSKGTKGRTFKKS